MRWFPRCAGSVGIADPRPRIPGGQKYAAHGKAPSCAAFILIRVRLDGRTRAFRCRHYVTLILPWKRPLMLTRWRRSDIKCPEERLGGQVNVIIQCAVGKPEFLQTRAAAGAPALMSWCPMLTLLWRVHRNGWGRAGYSLIVRKPAGGVRVGRWLPLFAGKRFGANQRSDARCRVTPPVWRRRWIRRVGLFLSWAKKTLPLLTAISSIQADLPASVEERHDSGSSGRHKNAAS